MKYLTAIFLFMSVAVMANYQSCMGEVDVKRNELEHQEALCKAIQDEYPAKLKDMEERHKQEKDALKKEYGITESWLKRKF